MANPQAAVIGYGYAGRAFHSYLIDITPGLDLRGVASRSEQTRARIRTERGCRAYAGLGEVLADPAVDLVVLATPNHVHCQQAVAAMDAGKAVVTDKPMCTSLEEADRMIEASRRNGVLLTVFQNRRWDGDYLTLRKLLQDGELGELRWLEMTWQNSGPPGRWRGRADEGSGRFWDLGAHMVDQVLMIFPQAVESVYCRLQHDFAGPEITAESYAMCTVTFAGGATAVVDAGSICAIRKPRILAYGLDGAFRKYGLDPQEGAMNAGDIDSAEEPQENYGTVKTDGEERTVPTVPGRWRSFYENVRDVLRGEADPAVKIPEMRRLMAVFDAAFRSAEEGIVVHPEIEGLA